LIISRITSEKKGATSFAARKEKKAITQRFRRGKERKYASHPARERESEKPLHVYSGKKKCSAGGDDFKQGKKARKKTPIGRRTLCGKQ